MQDQWRACSKSPKITGGIVTYIKLHRCDLQYSSAPLRPPYCQEIIREVAFGEGEN